PCPGTKSLHRSLLRTHTAPAPHPHTARAPRPAPSGPPPIFAPKDEPDSPLPRCRRPPEAEPTTTRIPKSQARHSTHLVVADSSKHTPNAPRQPDEHPDTSLPLPSLTA